MAKTRRTITEPAHSILYSPGSLPPSSIAYNDGIYNEVAKTLLNPLNESQKQVFESSFNERITLLWGPPGTGKTTVLAAIILGWIENAQSSNQKICIAVGSSNWTAIDNVLDEVADLIKQRTLKNGDFLSSVGIYRVRSEAGDVYQRELINDIIVSDTAAANLKVMLENPSECIIVGSTWKQFYNLSKPYWNEPAEVLPWFDLLLIDEASQVKVSSASAYCLYLKAHANVVFAGDDKQLGPINKFQMEDDANGLFDCIYSYMKQTHGIEPKPIVDNYRSNEQITAWPSQRFYKNQLNAVHSKKKLAISLPSEKPLEWPKDLPWSDSYLNILDPEKPVVIITYPPNSFTVSNPFEAQLVTALSFLYRKSSYEEVADDQFYKDHLGIVTPHRAQRSNIQNLLSKYARIDADPSIVVDTVDRFQGQERDLIIASYTVADRDFVRSEEEFILDPRRFNVSLTRSKSKFIMIINDAIIEHLPSDKNVAGNAAHIQLFVENFCNTKKSISLEYINLRGENVQVPCVLRT